MTKEANLLSGNVFEEVNGMEPSLFQPREEVKKSETIVTTIDDPFLQKIFATAMYHARESKIGKTNHEFSSEKDKDLEADISRNQHLSEALGTFFWYLLKEKYQLWNEHGLSLRKGWIVIRDREEELPSFIKNLLGRE